MMPCIEQPTKEEWARIEEQMNRLYGKAVLEVDGYMLSLCSQIVNRKMVIVPYVDGWFKGEWIIHKTEEARRFLRHRYKSVYSDKKKRSLERIFGKKKAREYFDIDKRLELIHADWPSFRPLKRHLIKNNERIKVISIGYNP